MMSCDRFDPIDWLRRFEASGGWYIVQDEKVHAGWAVQGNLDDEAAREIWREITDSEDRRSLVRAIILAGLAI